MFFYARPPAPFAECCSRPALARGTTGVLRGSFSWRAQPAPARQPPAKWSSNCDTGMCDGREARSTRDQREIDARSV
eukprot:5199576-Pleurochrysis_carterae.AAC.1